MSDTPRAPCVEMYTDGSTPKGNPGRGGYAAIWREDGTTHQRAGGFLRTTINRMEIFAAIAGLEALKEPRVVHLRSDSQYLVNTMNKGWLKKWKGYG